MNVVSLYTLQYMNCSVGGGILNSTELTILVIRQD